MSDYENASPDARAIPHVTLTQEQLEEAHRWAKDVRARASEMTERFAAPGERKEVGLRIDPKTARVFFLFTEMLDEYGDGLDIPEEAHCIGRTYFAVDPVEGIAVARGDLPPETRQALFGY